MKCETSMSGSDANPLICTVAAVIENPAGCVLLVRKQGSAILIQPGGKPEPGELPQDTLMRELAEELGVRLAPESMVFLGQFEDVAVHEPGRRVRSQAYVCRVHGTPTACAEIAELVWLDPTDLGKLRVAPLSATQILPAFIAWRAGQRLGAAS